ncbi:MAG: hypothetical protein OEU92_16905 [Alphaproteobacteria bacterium]|nr:hypothetical protein [Alphaproteobacteria bacterium]
MDPCFGALAQAVSRQKKRPSRHQRCAENDDDQAFDHAECKAGARREHHAWQQQDDDQGHDKHEKQLSLKTLSIDPCQQCEHKADNDGACEDQLDHADVLV